MGKKLLITDPTETKFAVVAIDPVAALKTILFGKARMVTALAVTDAMCHACVALKGRAALHWSYNICYFPEETPIGCLQHWLCEADIDDLEHEYCCRYMEENMTPEMRKAREEKFEGMCSNNAKLRREGNRGGEQA